MNIALLFPGQGSQHVGMGYQAYERSPQARAVFAEADALVGFSLSELCFYGPEELLTDTAYQQPALFTTSVAQWRALTNQDGWRPRFMAGHSLGEFAALVAAGSVRFGDGLALVRKRGELMKRAGEQHPGAMSAILGLAADDVLAICRQASVDERGSVHLANDNCPGQVVISGHEAALAEAERLATDAGARKIVRLPISIAAHTPLMNSAAMAFAEAVDATPIADPEVPVLSNVSARPLTSKAAVREDLKQQLTSPVAWTDSMRFLLAQGTDTFVEVGPGDVLLGLVKRLDRGTQRVKFDPDGRQLGLER